MKKLRKAKFPLLVLTFLNLFLFFSITSTLAIYERRFTDKIYPGIKVGDVDVSTKTKGEVRLLFEGKNKSLTNVFFTLRYEEKLATVSATRLHLGFNAALIADQAFSIGRTGNLFADLFNKGRAWFGELSLPASYSLNRELLDEELAQISQEVAITPVDAVFEMKGNRVVAFRPETVGKAIDMEALEKTLLTHIRTMFKDSTSQFVVDIPIKTLQPGTSLESTNTLGIKEHIGQGTSKFAGSIANRTHNIDLSASRIDGTIVKPGEVFSFNDTVGDVSKLTGYKEAYIIKDGKTILGDGGGVCQVSTTLFRAMLNSSLPIIERHAHSYRVSYYEQDSPPGLDATVYAPSYDLKFKNDTGAAILIEAYADTANSTLVFDLYGTSDGRKVSLSKSTITNQIPAPEDFYQDDPTLPKGAIKQIDFRAAGATVKFKRTVTRNGETIITDSYTSAYRPWQAVFLRGTKEN